MLGIGMKQDRIALIALAAACIVGMTACNRTHTPSDAQLTQLLRVERAPATDPQAPLDPAAVNCLRAWSGDVELTATLPAVTTGEAAKKMCRQRLDGWIADATRNPDKVKFEEVSAPPSVRRAVALLAEHRAATAGTPMPSPRDQPPPGLVSAECGAERAGRHDRDRRRGGRARRLLPESQTGRGERRDDAADRTLRELLRQAHRAIAHAHCDDPAERQQPAGADALQQRAAHAGDGASDGLAAGAEPRLAPAKSQ